MPVNLSIKNVPDDVARGLRSRAAYNQRSLQEEVLEILKEAAKDQAPVTIDGLLATAQRKKLALDEAASRVRAAQDAEQEKMAQRFQDLMARPADADPGELSGGEHRERSAGTPRACPEQGLADNRGVIRGKPGTAEPQAKCLRGPILRPLAARHNAPSKRPMALTSSVRVLPRAPAIHQHDGLPLLQTATPAEAEIPLPLAVPNPGDTSW